MPFHQKLLGLNWLLLLVTLVLVVFGPVAVYSATFMREGDLAYMKFFWQKQLIWNTLGFIVFLVTAFMDYRWTRWAALPAYLLSLALLAYVLRTAPKWGARSWIDLGPMNFQPSQLAILSGILLLALILTDYRRLPPLLMLALCGAAAGLPCLLIIIQPDLGSVLVWGPVFLAMIFVAGLPKRHLALMGLGALFALPVALLVLKPYQLARLLIFRNPDEDPLGEGWSILQCLTAIGSGGFSGKGFLAHGTQNELGFLPASVAHNDFIFAVIGEQFGFQGGILLIAAFALLLLSSLYIASQARDRLGLLLAIGVTSLLFAHVFMNIGMTIQLTPITGLPLPLVSYGGTFAVLVLFCLGLLQSIWIHREAGQSEPLPDSEHVLDLSLQSLPPAPVNR